MWNQKILPQVLESCIFVYLSLEDQVQLLKTSRIFMHKVKGYCSQAKILFIDCWQYNKEDTYLMKELIQLSRNSIREIYLYKAASLYTSLSTISLQKPLTIVNLTPIMALPIIPKIKTPLQLTTSTSSLTSSNGSLFDFIFKTDILIGLSTLHMDATTELGDLEDVITHERFAPKLHTFIVEQSFTERIQLITLSKNAQSMRKITIEKVLLQFLMTHKCIQHFHIKSWLYDMKPTLLFQQLAMCPLLTLTLSGISADLKDNHNLKNLFSSYSESPLSSTHKFTKRRKLENKETREEEDNKNAHFKKLYSLELSFTLSTESFLIDSLTFLSALRSLKLETKSDFTSFKDHITEAQIQVETQEKGQESLWRLPKVERLELSGIVCPLPIFDMPNLKVLLLNKLKEDISSRADKQCHLDNVLQNCNQLHTLYLNYIRRTMRCPNPHDINIISPVFWSTIPSLRKFILLKENQDHANYLEDHHTQIIAHNNRLHLAA